MYIIDTYIDRNNYRLDRAFSYQVTKAQYEKLLFGSSVLVTFNNQKLMAFVIKKYSVDDVKFKIKSIVQIIDINTLDTVQLQMYKFISENFITSSAMTLKLILPLLVRKTLKAAKDTTEVEVKKILAYQVGTESVHLTAKQQACYQLVKQLKVVTNSQLLKDYQIGSYVIKKLVELNVLQKIYIDYDYQYKHNFDQYKDIKLTSQQKDAVMQIKNSQKDCLLHGVTGSGKTEIFIELIKSLENSEDQTLILVPEISLTVAITSRLETVFGDELIFIHSGLTQKEYYDYYLKIKNGSAKIIVGTRSAIFMPYKKLKLIIVDEEHDQSYKHQQAPFYHVKDMIKFWQTNYETKVVYATATPSLESYVRAKKDIFTLVELKNRFNQNPLPIISFEPIIDYEQIFTYNSLKLIKEKLEKEEKVVVLYNKKGYAMSMECKVCNHIDLCPCCGVPLTYYQKINALKCNICGHYQYFKNTCKSCNSIDCFKPNGIGIEKVHDYLMTMFGEDTTIQIDRDVVQKKTKLQKILKDFKKPGKKILLGTQIISKGLDFTDVNLVVVVNVDNALYFNDIRAYERVFQLLVQTAGRAGRHNKEAEVIIQTKHPQHHVFKYVGSYDYLGFYENEMLNRRLLKNPPFFNVAQIEARHDSEIVAFNCLNELKQQLINSQVYTSEINVPYVQTFDKKKRKVMIIRYKDSQLIKTLAVFKQAGQKKGINIIIDLNIY